MTCNNCGQQNSDQNKFCQFCGKALVSQVIFTQPKEANILALVIIFALVCVVGLSILVSVSLVSLNSVRSRARDAKRVSDIRQILSYLENFHAENGSYPESLEELQSRFPNAPIHPPTPADGTCKESPNKYVYTKNSTNDFLIVFCLGGQASDLSPGVHTAGSSGIDN